MKSSTMEMLVEPRLVILLTSVIFCTGNAMPKKDKLAAVLDRLPELETTTVPSSNKVTSSAVTQNQHDNIEQEMTQLICSLYRDQHFEHISALKKQKRKKK